jgi:hypothetical protein
MLWFWLWLWCAVTGGGFDGFDSLLDKETPAEKQSAAMCFDI